MSQHEPRGSQPHPRGTGRNPATSTRRSGPRQPKVTTRVNSGEAEQLKLSQPSARVFDGLAARVGAVVAGRNTYEDSDHFGGGSPHPTARLVVLSHRPAPEITERQTLVTTSIQDAIAAARKVADGKDVGLMGGGVATEALTAGLVDEVVLHQVPVLLGAGRSFFQELPKHVHLRLLEATPAPGVTHLHYEVVR
jgi:dihydrofolate reductase